MRFKTYYAWVRRRFLEEPADPYIKGYEDGRKARPTSEKFQEQLLPGLKRVFEPAWDKQAERDINFLRYGITSLGAEMLLREATAKGERIAEEMKNLRNGLKAACVVVADMLGTCPCDQYGWTAGCLGDACDNNSAECWYRYFAGIDTSVWEVK